LEEARQELALDCLVHDRDLQAMPRRERHSRWFRLVERTAYHAGLRSTRRVQGGVDPDQLAGSWEHPAHRLPGLLRTLRPGDARLVRRIARQASRKRNGSWNLVAAARALGVDRRTLRKVWGRVADSLGFDAEYASFWARRLAEALTGLAADLLRSEGVLHLWQGTRRPPPDPESRRRRLRRIRTALGARPVAPRVRSALAAALRTDAHAVAHACNLLDHAAAMDPESASTQLWRYEALALTGRLQAAAEALERAERHGADPVRIALARAQLHQRRGNTAQAVAVMEAAHAQSRADRRTAEALALLRGVSPPAPQPAPPGPARSTRRRRAARRTPAW
ncbi:MAG: hypothetical protein RL148_1943, partial [Planctomycetota bacterium]